MRYIFTICVLSTFFCLTNIEQAIGQKFLNSLKTSLLKAPKDSVARILKQINENLSKEKYNVAQNAWIDLFNSVQKKQNVDLLIDVYAEMSGFYAKNNKFAQQIEITFDLINYGKTKKLSKIIAHGYESLFYIYKSLNQPDKALENMLNVLYPTILNY